MKSYLTFVIVFLVAYLSLPILRGLAYRFNIFDLPGGRKIHKIATPLLGGASLYTGLIVGLFINQQVISLFLPIIIGATLVFVLGLVSDIIDLSARVRIICQFIIAFIVISMGVHVTFVPKIYGKELLEHIITAIWLVGVTNAYNYLDGLDGLAAGSAAINLFCFSVILYTTGQYALGLLVISLIASCLAFLPYNLKNNKIFLGEAGSTFLGFMLAGIGLVGDWASNNVVKLSIPILVLGVPIFDMIFTTIMRIGGGKVKNFMEWLKYSGKDHFHHYLVDLGFRPIGSVIFIYFLTFSLGISAINVSNDDVIGSLLAILHASIIFGVIATLMVIGKRRRSGWSAIEKSP